MIKIKKPIVKLVKSINQNKASYLIFVSLIVLVFFAQGVNSHNKDDLLGIYPKAEYLKDLKQMVNVLTENHPQPFAFIPKDSFQLIVQQQMQEIHDSTTLGQFIWHCRKIVASIGCGHTSVYRPEKRMAVPESLLFPLHVRYIGSQLFVLDSVISPTQLAKGMEVVNINGIDVEDILKEIFKHISADGYNESAKRYYINNYFQKYCSFYFGFPVSYTIIVKNEEKLDTISLLSLEKVETKLATETTCEKNLCFEIKEAFDTAIITIGSFNYYGANLATFKSFIDNSFSEIKNKAIKNLIIDLRGNGGGDPESASYLLQHIAKQPFTYFHQDIAAYEELRKPILPLKQGFEGKPYILIDGRGFSTTGHVCSLIKYHNMGIFVGEELGSTYTCNDNSQRLRLKNTDLMVNVATYTYKTAVEGFPKNKGILPDYEVVLSIADLIGGGDAVMDYTLELIKE